MILTTFDLDEHVYDALKAGDNGFLLKDLSPEQLVAAVLTVSQGDALLSPSVTRRLIESFTAVAARRVGLPPFSASAPGVRWRSLSYWPLA